MKKSNCLALCLLTLAALSVPASETLELHVKIVETREASAPHLFNDEVFFSYKPLHPTRYVGIAFAHENFREIHVFQRNDRNVFFFLYPPPEGRSRLDYRLVVDGLWTTDPSNPLMHRDPTGISMSRFDLPPRTAPRRVHSPVIRKDVGMVEFTFQGPPDSDVHLVGSFNSWDPYMHPMREADRGLYTLSLRLLPGNYAYAFYAEGRRVSDPLNPRRIFGPDGSEVSLLAVSR